MRRNRTQVTGKDSKDRGPCLYIHAVGPGSFWSACWILTELEDEERGFRYICSSYSGSFEM